LCLKKVNFVQRLRLVKAPALATLSLRRHLPEAEVAHPVVLQVPRLHLKEKKIHHQALLQKKRRKQVEVAADHLASPEIESQEVQRSAREAAREKESSIVVPATRKNPRKVKKKSRKASRSESRRKRRKRDRSRTKSSSASRDRSRSRSKSGSIRSKDHATIEALLAGLETRLASVRTTLNEPRAEVSPLDVFQIQLELRATDFKKPMSTILAKLNAMATQLHSISSGRTSKKSTRSSKADVKSEPSSSDKKASPKASPTLVDAATQTDRDVAMSDNSFSISSSDPTQTVKPDITLSAEPELTEIQFVHPPMPTIVPGGDFEDSSVLVLGRPPGVGFKAASAPGVALKPAAAGLGAPAVSLGAVHASRLAQITVPALPKSMLPADDEDREEGEVEGNDAVSGSSDVKFKAKKKKVKPSVLPAGLSQMVNKWNAINQEEKRKEEKFARTLDPEYKQMKQKQQTKEFITASLASGKAYDNPNFQPLQADWRQRVRSRQEGAKESEKD
jgi:hypothetical protein